MNSYDMYLHMPLLGVQNCDHPISAAEESGPY